MIDIAAAYADYLKVAIPALNGYVAGITELEEATSSTKLHTPYAYAITLGEQAGPNPDMTVRITQRVTLTFALVLAVSNKVNPLGIKAVGAQTQLHTLRNAAIMGTLGWQATPDFDPATYKSGRLVQAQNGVLWWQDEFETAFYLTK